MRFTHAAMAAVFGLLFLGAEQASAQVDPPEEFEFVRVCDMYGSGWYFIPGTETCLRPETGETRTQTDDGPVSGQTEIADRLDALEELLDEEENARVGTAVALALENPDLTGDEKFGLSMNWGQYEGSHAFGVAATGVVVDTGTSRFAVSGGVSVGERGNIGTRAGAQFTW